MLIKAGVTRELHRMDYYGVIWQQRYWEHLIRDESDFAAHADYIHYNPVRHGHVGCAAAWPWSSFHSWLRDGCYDAGWGDSGLDFEEGVGSE